MTNATNANAERAEQARDLRSQIAGLEGQDEREIIIRDTSPARRRATLYSMENGQPVTMPEYMAQKAIDKRLPDGRYMFTARQDQAPVFKLPEFRCFLAIDSEERKSGLLDRIGLGGGQICLAQNLGGAYSARIHGEHRHKQEWAMLKEHLADQEKDEAKAAMARQTEAMLALAGVAHPEAADTVAQQAAQLTCECEWVTPLESKNPTASLGTHKRMHCPLRPQALAEAAESELTEES